MKQPFEHREAFTNVNPDWEYAIDAAKMLKLAPTSRFLVWFDFQRDAFCWLAGCGTKEFRLMDGATVVKLLNEALNRGLLVVAVHRKSGQAFYFLNPPTDSKQ